MIVYAAGVPIAGFSTNISTMIIARGLQGVGISMFPIAFSIVRDQFPREKMAIGQGIITSMFAGGAVIGLSIGGFIIQHYGLQYTFFTIIPIVVALFFIVWRFIHVDPVLQPRDQQRQESEYILRKVSSVSDKKGGFRKRITKVISLSHLILFRP
jgi:MFS family permease